jgi:hypothetical protein
MHELSPKMDSLMYGYPELGLLCVTLHQKTKTHSHMPLLIE